MAAFSVLGVESSCDETAMALLRGNKNHPTWAFSVVENVVASQIKTHAAFGGVVPEIAAREHVKALPSLWKVMASHAPTIDAIAVTQGPGLVGTLLIGGSFAKGLAIQLGKPLVAVNHVHGHVYGALLALEGDLLPVFPALALVVSGGHTNIYYMESPLSFALISQSMDDACGECFDKSAKMMGMGYPGGPAIETLAKDGDDKAFPMPNVMSQTLDFSYSGLKTHILQQVRKLEAQGELDSRKADLCASFQRAAIDQLVHKTKMARESFPETKSVIVAGGVAANQTFRRAMDALGTHVVYPPLAYCSDNAAMIAHLGGMMLLDSEGLRATDSWDVFSRARETKFFHENR